MKFPVTHPLSYPSHVYTGLLGDIMRRLTACGAPAEIVGAVLMAVASLLTQSLADVIWPNGLRAAIGANNWVIASSTSGKSLIYKILVEPIEAYLAERSKGNNSTFDFFIEDATREALLQSLASWPVASLQTDEAGMITKLLRDAATLVKLLDGSPIRSARVSTGRVALLCHRLCALFMEQPDVFEEKKVHLGASKGGIGLANRFFFARLNRLVSDTSLHQLGLSDSLKQAYDKKIQELLDASILQVEKKGHERPALHLRVDAIQYLLNLDNAVRRNCSPGFPWFFISEYASRHVERVLRLAGTLHVFEHGIEGEISVDTIERSDILGQWYVESFAQIFYEPPKLSQTEADAIELEAAIRRAGQASGHTLFKQSEMRAYAPNLGLTPARFTRALAALGGQGKIRVHMQRNVPWIELNAPTYSWWR